MACWPLRRAGVSDATVSIRSESTITSPPPPSLLLLLLSLPKSSNGVWYSPLYSTGNWNEVNDKESCQDAASYSVNSLKVSYHDWYDGYKKRASYSVPLANKAIRVWEMPKRRPIMTVWSINLFAPKTKYDDSCDKGRGIKTEDIPVHDESMLVMYEKGRVLCRLPRPFPNCFLIK